MKSGLAFLIMNVMTQRIRLITKTFDVIPESPAKIDSLFFWKQKLFVGKSDGFFTILNQNDERIQSFQFESSIHKIKAEDNCLLLQCGPHKSLPRHLSLIYFQSSHGQRHRRLVWNDTSLYETIHPLEHYHFRLNHFGDIRMDFMHNDSMKCYHIPYSNLQKAFLHYDHLFLMTNDNELVIYKIHSSGLKQMNVFALMVEKSIVSHFHVHKEANLVSVIFMIHKVGLYVYYFTHEEDKFEPVYQTFHEMKEPVSAFSVSLPYISILRDDGRLTILRIAVHNDKSYHAPMCFFESSVTHTELTNQIVFNDKKKCLILNGNRKLLCLYLDFMKD